MADQNLTSRIATSFWKRRHPGVWQSVPDHDDPQLDLTIKAVPRWVVDQVGEAAHRRLRKSPAPWITADAVRLLDGLLRPTDNGIEFGAGSSTAWIAKRVKTLVSVEANPVWRATVQSRLDEAGLDNVDLHFVGAESLGYESPEHRDAYVNVRPDLEPESLDLVFVDGSYRAAAALRGINLLKPGGLFVLDNVNIYLPAPTRTPWRVRKPASPQWATFLDRVHGWRRIWTTDGTSDTAMWFKP